MGGYGDEIDDTEYVDQPKDGLKGGMVRIEYGLMGGMVRVEYVAHGDQPEGRYGGECNGMGGNQPMYVCGIGR